MSEQQGYKAFLMIMDGKGEAWSANETVVCYDGLKDWKMRLWMIGDN